MTQYSGATASVLPPRAPGSLEPDYSTPSIYRYSIRRVSVSGSLSTSARFFLPTGGDVSSAGEGAYYCWSSASSASWDASAGCSSVSLSFSSDGDLCFSGWGAADDPDGDDELRAIARQMVHDGCMKGLIRGFSAGRSSSSSSAHYGCLGPDTSASREELLLLGSWFSELDVEWLLPTGQGDSRTQLHLHLQDGCASLQDPMERWIKALKAMVQVLRITQLDLRAKKPAASGNGTWHFMLLAATGKTADHEEEVAQFTRFDEVSLLRMLDFVDAVADAALNDDHSPETLPGMLQVYTCVVDDSPIVMSLFDQASSATSTSMFEAMNFVFLRKRDRLSDAIRSMIAKVTDSFLRDRCCWTRTVSMEEEAGGVHKTTMLMMSYVMFLSRIEGALSFGLHDSSSSPVVKLIKGVISCLEKQLERTSNLISDPGLRYLYLMNNYSFVSKKVSSLLLPPWTLMEDYKIEKPRKRGSVRRLPPMEDYVNQPDPNLRAKIETDSNLDRLVKTQSFIEAYLDASWEPVMACLKLNHDIPHGFIRSGRAVDKFESEFQRTYAMQKHWKVPNPELRKRLRKAIIEKVISGYSKYLAEQRAKWKSIGQPKNTPLELEQLLEELFEG